MSTAGVMSMWVSFIIIHTVFETIGNVRNRLDSSYLRLQCK